MSSWNFLSGMGSDVLSVEVNGDGYPFNTNQSFSTFDFELHSLFDNDFMGEVNIAGVCDSADLTESITCCLEPNELDKYFGPSHSTDPTSDIDQNLLVHKSLPIYTDERFKKAKGNKKPIALSSSVGVGISHRLPKSSHKIEIVYDLEEKFRPRYKSDYFAQNGTKRKPRYVTDRNGNHYITLKVPIGIQGKFRIDWLTLPDENGDRYLMPYRFQASNESSEIADINPIWIDITADSSGMMKVYLVLIKAKQDALKSLQPLQPFHPMQDVLGKIDKPTPEKLTKLTPKQLIQKYQLGRSQLAFTLCTLSTDGKSYIPEWDTTVYSTVLEEEASDNPVAKTVLCPKCSCSITISDEGLTNQEIPAGKRKNAAIKTEKTKTMKKQKSLSSDVVYDFD